MKAIKVSLVIMAAALLTIGLGGMAYAFHQGGVADCEGCHTMHNSLGGKAMTTAFPQYTAGPFLLQGATPSEACLNCHAETPAGSSYHVLDNTFAAGSNLTNVPGNYTPGGDFGWVKITYSAASHGNPSPGDRHGHNVIAPAFGLLQDATQTTAPGGTYPSASLACSSCHDPHGRYRRDASGNVGTPTGGTHTVSLPIWASGSYYDGKAVSDNEPKAYAAVGVYRILGGNGYNSAGGVTPFSADPPAAKVNSTYDYTAGDQAQVVRVAYGSGMSEWCANCHSSMLQNGYTSGMAGLSHPAGNSAKLGTTIAGNYNSYIATGNMGGSQTTSGDTLAPFELGSTDYAGTLAPLAINTVWPGAQGGSYPGPEAAGTSSGVACISCHRAHASSFDSILRFSATDSTITGDDGSGNSVWVASGSRTTAVTQGAYYNRLATRFAPYQRAWCNKCHAKD
ncbi:MAG: cytochrome C [bacterium]